MTVESSALLQLNLVVLVVKILCILCCSNVLVIGMCLFYVCVVFCNFMC